MATRDLVERSGLTTLRARREHRELVLARKCTGSATFGHWFPVRDPVRDTRLPTKYEGIYARTPRC